MTSTTPRLPDPPTYDFQKPRRNSLNRRSFQNGNSAASSLNSSANWNLRQSFNGRNSLQSQRDSLQVNRDSLQGNGSVGGDCATIMINGGLNSTAGNTHYTTANAGMASMNNTHNGTNNVLNNAFSSSNNPFNNLKDATATVKVEMSNDIPVVVTPVDMDDEHNRISLNEIANPNNFLSVPGDNVGGQGQGNQGQGNQCQQQTEEYKINVVNASTRTMPLYTPSPPAGHYDQNNLFPSQGQGSYGNFTGQRTLITQMSAASIDNNGITQLTDVQAGSLGGGSGGGSLGATINMNTQIVGEGGEIDQNNNQIFNSSRVLGETTQMPTQIGSRLLGDTTQIGTQINGVFPEPDTAMKTGMRTVEKYGNLNQGHYSVNDSTTEDRSQSQQESSKSTSSNYQSRNQSKESTGNANSKSSSYTEKGANRNIDVTPTSAAINRQHQLDSELPHGLLLEKLRASNRTNAKLTQDLQQLFEKYLDTCAENDRIKGNKEQEISKLEFDYKEKIEFLEKKVNQVNREKEKIAHTSRRMDQELEALRKNHSIAKNRDEIGKELREAVNGLVLKLEEGRENKGNYGPTLGLNEVTNGANSGPNSANDSISFGPTSGHGVVAVSGNSNHLNSNNSSSSKESLSKNQSRDKTPPHNPSRRSKSREKAATNTGLNHNRSKDNLENHLHCTPQQQKTGGNNNQLAVQNSNLNKTPPLSSPNLNNDKFCTDLKHKVVFLMDCIRSRKLLTSWAGESALMQQVERLKEQHTPFSARKRGGRDGNSSPNRSGSKSGAQNSSSGKKKNLLSREDLNFRIEVLSQELLRRNDEQDLIMQHHRLALNEISHLKNQIQELKGNIRVFVRVRPLTSCIGNGNEVQHPGGSNQSRAIHVKSVTGETLEVNNSNQNQKGGTTPMQRGRGCSVLSINSPDVDNGSNITPNLTPGLGGEYNANQPLLICGLSNTQHNLITTQMYSPQPQPPTRLTSLLLHHPTQALAGGRPLFFSFDRVFSENCCQQTIFEEVQPLLENTVTKGYGYHLGIFAYGQTGSGKTHTLDGTDNDPGILRRSVEELCRTVKNRNLAAMQQQNANPNSNQQQNGGNNGGGTTKLVLSVLEIYNETVRDLLQAESTEEENLMRARGLDTTPERGNQGSFPGLSPRLESRERSGSSARGTGAVSRNGRSPRQRLTPRSGMVAGGSTTPKKGARNGSAGAFNSNNPGGYPTLEIRSRANSGNETGRGGRWSSTTDGGDGGNLDKSARDYRDSYESTGNNGQTGPNIGHSSLFGSIYVDGLTSLTINSWNEAERALNRARAKRAVGSTNLNDVSSRSHCIFSLGLVSERGKYTGALHIIDLAGSERVKLSGAEGARLTESKHINKSLSALGDTLFALEQRGNGNNSYNSGNTNTHVPFRNSKLSWLLSDVLSGQWSKVLFFSNIHPGEKNLQESFSTLTFAGRISNIEKGKLVAGR